KVLFDVVKPKDNINTTMESKKKAKKNNRCYSLLQMLRDFCGYTTFGGLGRVVGTKFIVFKVLWLLLFLAAVSMAIYQLIPLFWKYQSRPVSTRISLRYNSTLDFPSVVLCNFNMLRKSEIEDLPEEAREVIQGYLGGTYEPIYTTQELCVEFHKLKMESHLLHETMSKQEANETRELEGGEEGEEYEVNPDLLDRVYKQEEKLSVLMAGLDPDDLKPMGHQHEQMIRSCTFKGVNCRNFKKYWTQFWHYKYGNCFMFNRYISKGKQLKGATASKSGPLYGLTIEMDIEQEEYIDQLTQNAGAVVLISVRGKMPFPYEEGLSLAPGFATSMGLRLLQVNRIDPFKNQSCIRNDPVNIKNIYSKKYNVSYSKTACEQSCLAHSQRKECKCMEYKFPVAKGKICDILNKTTISCLRKVARKAQQNKLICSSICRPLCSNNLLKIQIFFQELNFEVIEESISYQIENFLSDVGGQLGLWLGVSVLSGVEVVELLALMLIYLFKNRSNTVTLNDPVTMEEGGLDNKSTEF
ncbi:hypothetical protein QZH41_020444, partial [Actinostola sp. cb2023]